MGLNHMAIQVEDYEELKDYYSKLQQYYEVDQLRTVDHSMTKSIYITDPDGNGIELFCNTFDTAEEGLAEMRRPAARTPHWSSTRRTGKEIAGISGAGFKPAPALCAGRLNGIWTEHHHQGRRP